jgi:hypothetical protein
MITAIQQRRLDLYRAHRSLQKVAEIERVSKEAVRLSLVSLSDSDYEDYKAIATLEKGGRPRVYKNRQEQNRLNAQNWRARKKLNPLAPHPQTQGSNHPL